MEGEAYPRAEEALRLLAAAVGAARLYPPGSPLPREAIERFVSRTNELTLSEPLRFIVEPDGFRVASHPVATGQNQVVLLAEALYAMQAGQLVIVSGITVAEATAFVAIANSDPSGVRAGGVRAALVAAGITHIAAIEVSLRASDETGLAGVDLTTAPLEEIAGQVASAVERRAAQANRGPADDEVAEALSRLESATHEIAMERMSTALMRLDERTRMRVLGLSLKADVDGRRMEGMLSVIARMKPAALARLLRLVAEQSRTDPRRIASALTLPPETMKLLQMILTPKPQLEPDDTTGTIRQAERIAEIIATEPPSGELDRQVAVAAPALTAGRALATATAVARVRLNEDTIRAISDVLPQAARDGAFATVREALRCLDEMANEPSLTEDVTAARMTLADPEVLADVCEAPVNDADAAIAGEILHAAGPAGAEALLAAYVRMPEARRSLLRPVMRGMSEGVLGVARQRIRGAEPGLAAAIVQSLPHLGDRRAVPVIAAALDHLDEQIRFAAASALASMPVPEARSALLRALNHREPETQRYVVRTVGAARIADAVPSLARALEDINVLRRTYETRKEIIAALEGIGTPEAERALRRFAQRTLGLGRKTRELKRRAREVADELARNRGVSQP